jgi:hypothetical protein
MEKNSFFNMFKFYKSSIITNIINIIIYKFKILKLSFIFGTHGLYFSLSSLYLPFTGLFFNYQNISIIFIIKLIYLSIFSKYTILASTLLYLPGFFASLYLAFQSKFLKILFSILLIAIFLMHIESQSALIYVVYWMVPIFVSISGYNSIFLKALSSMFISHAVGTIISLNSGILNVDLINNIKYIVFIEKIIFASIITLFYYILYFATIYIRYLNYSFNKNLSLSVNVK